MKIFLIASLFPLMAFSQTIKVGVIDTGFDFVSTWNNKKGIVKPILCDKGHKDFVVPIENINYLVDNHGHGTHVAGLIAKHAKDADYCLIITKFYDPKAAGQDYINSNNLTRTVSAIRHLIKQDVDIINFSGGGLSRSEEECQAVKEALDKGILFVTAAGNEKSNLTKKKAYYPAMCDDRVVVVTNLSEDGKTLMPSSNYSASGSIDTFNERGSNQMSTLPGDIIGPMSGTSQAAAAMSGKLVKLLGIRSKKNNKEIKKPLK